MVLTTREALVALAEGRKIRPTHWPKKCYITLTSDGLIVDNVMDREEFNSEHNYVLFQEVQAEHEGRKYVYQVPGELHWHETSVQFISDEQFLASYPGVVNFVSLKEQK